MMNRWVVRFLELVLGSLLLVAGLLKLPHPEVFAYQLLGYHLFPVSWVPWLAVLLPALEVVVGIALVFRWFRWGARLWALVLFFSFWVAVLQAAARGIDTSCGCFGAASWEHTDVGKVLENTLWLLASLYIWVFGEKGR